MNGTEIIDHLNNLSLMLNNADGFDVTIQVGDNQNTKEFRAHSVILRARSPYFKSAFSADWIKRENNTIIFNKTNITPTIFDMILKYIYTGELDLSKKSGEDILELLVASDELLLKELFEHVQDYLIKKRSSWIDHNLVSVLNFTKIVGIEKLQDYCLGFIIKNPLKALLSLDRDILYDILKCDFFQIEKIVIWNSLIKWGIKQIPELKNKNNQAEWTDKNYEDLKNTLSDFIPLIKFSKITSEDFYHKVLPYRTIIPNNIYEEALSYYLVEQPKLNNRESNIIKPKLVHTISNWINDTEFGTSHYKFNLIYCGSRDGIDNESFKNKCKDRVESLVLIKVQQSNQIFGGYSSTGFKNVYQYPSDNFIFSFNGVDSIRSHIRRYKSIFDSLDSDSYGFNFGDAMFMINQNLHVNRRYFYDDIVNAKAVYAIEEIETFIVNK